MAEALSIKFRAAFEAVSKITETLEVDYSRHAFDATGLKSCCKLDDSGMEYNFLFKKKVMFAARCSLCIVGRGGAVVRQRTVYR